MAMDPDKTKEMELEKKNQMDLNKAIHVHKILRAERKQQNRGPERKYERAFRNNP